MEAVLPNSNNYEFRALKKKRRKNCSENCYYWIQAYCLCVCSVNTRQTIIPYSECKSLLYFGTQCSPEEPVYIKEHSSVFFSGTQCLMQPQGTTRDSIILQGGRNPYIAVSLYIASLFEKLVGCRGTSTA